jgi:hypothetical protein
LNDLIDKWNAISLKPYKAVTFTSYDKMGNIIYHTDCMLTLLSEHAVLCVTTIKEKRERKKVTLELCNPP